MTLLDLIEEHPGAWEYEWRTRFRVPLAKIGGRRMSWGEAFRLGMILLSDPSSRVGAAHAGLDGPVSREYVALQIMLANQYEKDTQKRASVRMLPDPFAPKPRRFGAGTSLTPEQFEAAIAAHREGGAARV